MTDLRTLLHDHAISPRRPLDVNAVIARAERAARRQRLWRWIAGLTVVGAALVPAGAALAPAGHSHPQTLKTATPSTTTTITSSAPRPPGSSHAASPSQLTAPTAPVPRSAATGSRGTVRGSPAASATPPQAIGGGLIAFIGTDGTIRVGGADGSGVRSLAAGLDPAWSPDGSRLAFWRGSGDTSGCENDPLGQTPKVCTGDVWLMRADGSGAHLVISNAMKPAWSPDGHRLVYSSAQPDSNGTHSLFVANADGTGVTQLTSGFADTGARWSPDGRTIVFGRCCINDNGSSVIELYAIAPDGSGLHWLWGNADVSAWAPAWSPDGSRIAFTAYPYAANRVSIRVLELATGDAWAITDEHQSGATWVQNMSYGPAWSPDGNRIAYTLDPDGATGTGDCDAGPTTGCAMGGSAPGTIYLVNPDGSAATKVTEGAWPAFQP